MSKKKSPLQAKIVKHAHRRRFYDSIRGMGKKRFTMSHVYWYMYLRSGAGDMFELAEELMQADLDMDHSTLYPVLKNLEKAGWIKKHRPRDTKTGRLGVITWQVFTSLPEVEKTEVEAEEPQCEQPTVEPTVGFTNGGTPNVGTTNGGKPDTTVVLHNSNADAPTLPQSPSAPSDCTPSASTGSDLSVSLSVSQAANAAIAASQKQEKVNPSTVNGSSAEQNQTPIPEKLSAEETLRLSRLEREQHTGFQSLMDTFGEDTQIPALLGMTTGRGGNAYFVHENEADMKRIVHWLVENNRSLSWLLGLIAWVKREKGREPDFWKKRIHTGDRALTQIADNLERGELPSQFAAHIVQRDGSDALSQRLEDAKRNHSDWLLRYWDDASKSLIGISYTGELYPHGKLDAEVEPVGDCFAVELEE